MIFKERFDTTGIVVDGTGGTGGESDVNVDVNDDVNDDGD